MMSTYKLTLKESFAYLQHQKQLILWTSAGPARRCLAFVPDIHSWLETEKEDLAHESLRQKTRAFCDNFLAETITLEAALKAIGSKDTLLQMRVMSPEPGVRIIGALIENSIFVGTHHYLRDEILFKHKPVAKQQKSWVDVQTDAREALKTLFGDVEFVPLKTAITNEEELL
jgi:hypothetical protein